ncbi:probable glutamate carboxypeptidase AMP1, partial [Tanacetum coccineum]
MAQPLNQKPNTSSCTLIFIFTLCIITVYTFHPHHEPPPSLNNPPFISTFLNSASNYTISTYLRHLTLHPHLAGTPPSSSAAAYVTSMFKSFNLQTHVTNYTVMLSYHVNSSLTAHFSNGSDVPITLTERVSDMEYNEVVKGYHAYSPSGTAYGKAVYVSHGREEDYRALEEGGVDVKGCIGVVKRGGGLSRYAAVVKAAEKGVVAVVMFTGGTGGGVERGTVVDGVGD